jgi:hypothetical protein
MTSFAKEQRKATNRAAYAVLRSEYDNLPAETRAKLVTEFKTERVRNPIMTWSKYLTVILPLLPAEAR